MRFVNTKDENLVVFYESIRQQVVADVRVGGRYRLIGDSVKQYADRLREEMDRRGVALYAHRLAPVIAIFPLLASPTICG
jgi:hypothetical protein